MADARTRFDIVIAGASFAGLALALALAQALGGDIRIALHRPRQPPARPPHRDDPRAFAISAGLASACWRCSASGR